MDRKTITAEEMTADSIAPYGELFNNHDVEPAFDSQVFCFWNDVSVGDVGNAPVSFVMVQTKPGPLHVPALERHVHTTETLVPLDSDVFLVLGTPTAGPTPDADTVKAFRLPRGMGVTLKKGTWHNVPLIRETNPAHTLVVFRQGTPTDDLEMRELSKDFGFEYVVQ